MRVLVVTEYYPREGDPINGIWAHRQAVAARDAGAEVRVLVLHRPIPPLATVRTGDVRTAIDVVRQPRSADLDGLRVDYMRYLSPPRPLSYSSWGGWAAPLLARALRRLRTGFPFDLVHAHYAVPAGDAVRRAAPQAPLVVSVHGHDVYGVGARSASVSRALSHAGLVIANSAGTARRSVACGARATRVVHLGADVPPVTAPQPSTPTLVTVGHLAARKCHVDVVSAVAMLRGRYPELRYLIVGDGPERERLREQAAFLGVESAVELRGRLPHSDAIAAAQSASLFVLPSVDEAFGVAYVEAMAGGVPAIGCRGEDGPEEIAAAGAGIELVPPHDVPALAKGIGALVRDRAELERLGREARHTVERAFTWERCGRETVDAYRELLDVDR